MLRTLLATTLIILSPLSTSFAQTSDRDLEVIARVLKFIDSADGNDRSIAVIYDAATQSEGEALGARLQSGLNISSITLTGQALSADQASPTNVHAYLLLGDSAQNTQVTDSALQNGIITLSMNMDCVTQRHCMMGLQSQPTVQILADRAKLDQAGIGFEPAFVMLIDEL